LAKPFTMEELRTRMASLLDPAVRANA